MFLLDVKKPKYFSTTRPLPCTPQTPSRFWHYAHVSCSYHLGALNLVVALNFNIKNTMIFAIVILCYRLRFEQVIFSILKLHLCFFNGCSLIKLKK